MGETIDLKRDRNGMYLSGCSIKVKVDSDIIELETEVIGGDSLPTVENPTPNVISDASQLEEVLFAPIDTEATALPEPEAIITFEYSEPDEINDGAGMGRFVPAPLAADDF